MIFVNYHHNSNLANEAISEQKNLVSFGFQLSFDFVEQLNE